PPAGPRERPNGSRLLVLWWLAFVIGWGRFRHRPGDAPARIPVRRVQLRRAQRRLRRRHALDSGGSARDPGGAHDHPRAARRLGRNGPWGNAGAVRHGAGRRRVVAGTGPAVPTPAVPAAALPAAALPAAGTGSVRVARVAA